MILCAASIVMPLLLGIFQATTSSSRRGMEDIGRGAAGADFGGKGRETFGGFLFFPEFFDGVMQ